MSFHLIHTIAIWVSITIFTTQRNLPSKLKWHNLLYKANKLQKAKLSPGLLEFIHQFILPTIIMAVTTGWAFFIYLFIYLHKYCTLRNEDGKEMVKNVIMNMCNMPLSCMWEFIHLLLSNFYLYLITQHRYHWLYFQ